MNVSIPCMTLGNTDFAEPSLTLHIWSTLGNVLPTYFFQILWNAASMNIYPLKSTAHECQLFLLNAAIKFFAELDAHRTNVHNNNQKPLLIMFMQQRSEKKVKYLRTTEIHAHLIWSPTEISLCLLPIGL